jgi:hypothetical protein
LSATFQKFDFPDAELRFDYQSALWAVLRPDRLRNCSEDRASTLLSKSSTTNKLGAAQSMDLSIFVVNLVNRKDEIGRTCSKHDGNVCEVLVGKPISKRPLGRSRHRWKGIRMDLGEIGWEYVDWIIGTVAGCCEHGNEPLGSIKRGKFLD